MDAEGNMFRKVVKPMPFYLEAGDSYGDLVNVCRLRDEDPEGQLRTDETSDATLEGNYEAKNGNPENEAEGQPETTMEGQTAGKINVYDEDPDDPTAGKINVYDEDPDDPKNAHRRDKILGAKRAKKQRKQTKDRILHLETTYSKLDAQNETLRAENETLRAQYKTVRAQKRTLQAQSTEKDREIKRVHNELDIHMRHYDIMDLHLKEMYKECEDLRKQNTENK